MTRLSNPPEAPKVSRAIRLDKDLDDQLLLVCKTLGVNPNAYLKQVVGEAINKHLSQYRIPVPYRTGPDQCRYRQDGGDDDHDCLPGRRYE